MDLVLTGHELGALCDAVIAALTPFLHLSLSGSDDLRP
jgi:hypothetical protein